MAASRFERVLSKTRKQKEEKKVDQFSVFMDSKKSSLIEKERK